MNLFFCHVCLHLNFWWGQRFPVVGFELVEFIKLQANVLDRQLEHVPETCQVLGDGPWVCIWVLMHKKSHTYTHVHMNTHNTQMLIVYTLYHIFSGKIFALFGDCIFKGNCTNHRLEFINQTPCLKYLAGLGLYPKYAFHSFITLCFESTVVNQN